jgi:hypothetical protein
VENFENSNFEFLRAFRRTLAEENQNRIKLHWSCTVLARSSTVAMLLGLSSIDSNSPSPDPSQEKRREAEVCTQGPPPNNLLPRAMPTSLEAPEETHSTPRPNHVPPSTRAWPPWPERPSNAARTPATASFWPRLPSTLQPIKGPADQTQSLTSLPSTSQT